MARAIELASQARTHPNPRVGAVVVSTDGDVVGEGWHEGPGTPHAEVVALDLAGERARGATVYVTLEPCNHHGRTPPCVDALIAAGVSTVVAGMIDPDPRTNGAGVERLRAAGVQVEVGLSADEAAAVDPAYFHHRATGMPLVTWKYAMTLDGSVAAADGTSRWITSDEARRDAHALRSRADAIVVGSGTVAADDPRLDVRLEGYEGPQPVPVMVLGEGDPPPQAQIWQRNPLVFTSRERRIPGGELVLVPGGDRPDPRDVCRSLAARGLLDVILEGGPTLAGEWWRAGVIDEGVAYLGARVGGGQGIPPLSGVFSTIEKAGIVSIRQVRSLGSDIRIDWTRDVHRDR